MHISIITIFPQMFAAVQDNGISARAIGKEALHLHLWNPRDFSENRARAVDARPFGGGPGMLMRPAPLAKAIDAAKAANGGEVIYLTPQGEKLRQTMLAELAAADSLILLAGRYGGVDERVIESRVRREISIGDYVLAGGELAAMVLVEGIARLLPGVLGNAESAEGDSFADALLGGPQYTRPEVFEGMAVPEVLLSGDHSAIAKWRRRQAVERTRARRPDLLISH